MSWQTLSYAKKGAIIGFVVALILFSFSSDFGRGIRHPITKFFIHSGEKTENYQKCIDSHLRYDDDGNLMEVGYTTDCYTKSGKFLWNIGNGINQVQNYFDGILMMFGYFGLLIWFGIGTLIGLIIGKIKIKKVE